MEHSPIRLTMVCILITISSCIVTPPAYSGALEDPCLYTDPTTGASPPIIIFAERKYNNISVYYDGGAPEWFDNPTGVIDQAIAAWTSLSPVVMSRTTSYDDPDVEVIYITAGWYSAMGIPCNVHGVCTDYTFTDDGFIKSCVIYINCDAACFRSDFNWYDNTGCTSSPTDVNSQSVITHELGHALGFIDLMDMIYDGISIMSDTLDMMECENEIYTLDRKTLFCYYGNLPTSSISEFRVIDKHAVWTVDSEHNTTSYVIEGCNTVTGPGVVIASAPPGIGLRTLAIPPNRFPILRLVEVDESSQRLPKGITSGNSAPFIRKREVLQHPSTEARLYDDVLPVTTDRAKNVYNVRTTPIDTQIASQDMLLFTSHELEEVVYNTIYNYWTNEGYHLGIVIGIETFPPNERKEMIKTFIGYEPQFYHIIGAWADEGSDTLSYQEMADVNNDGIPDVVVSTWPAEHAWQIDAATGKVSKHNNHVKYDPFTSAFFSGDVDLHFMNHYNSGQYVTHLIDELMIVHQESSGAQDVVEIRESDFPDDYSRAIETAATLNAHSDYLDLVTILSTGSSKNDPGHYFTTYNSGPSPWDITRLDPNTTFPLVIAASCESTPVEYIDGQLFPLWDLLFYPVRGTVGWIGSTGSTDQWSNYAISSLIIEELYAHPQRPMSESWLRAIQRAYSLFATSPEVLATIDDYVYYGDALSPFRASPTASISSYVYWADTDSLGAMPDYTANGCPQGDGGHIVFHIDTDPLDVPTDFTASDITIGQPSDTNMVFWGELTADTLCTLPNGDYRAEVVIESFSAVGTCGLDSVDVFLREYLVGKAYINVKSYDIVYGGTTAAVDISDFSKFSNHYTSSICDCVQPKSYSECFDYWAPGDTAVGIKDFSLFATHYLHNYIPPGLSAPHRDELAYSSGSITLTIEEDYPLQGQRTLDVSVSLNDLEPFKVMMLSFKTDNPVLEYLEWIESSQFPGITMATQINRNGIKQVVLGVVGSNQTSERSFDLGTFLFRVSSSESFEVQADDFKLLISDMLEVGDQRLVFQGSQMSRTIQPTVFKNQLSQNYPNPFNPTTTIAFSINSGIDVELNVYDVTGALVKRIVNEHRKSGVYKQTWDGQNNSGQQVASGIYLYRLVAGDYVATKKMVLLK